MSRIATNRSGSNVWLRPDVIYVVEIISRSGNEVAVDEFTNPRQAHEWAKTHHDAASEINVHRYTRAQSIRVWPLRCEGCSMQDCQGCDCECHRSVA